MALPKEQQLALIKENLAEFLNPEIVEDVLNRGETLRIYWGTATTGRPHVGYTVPMIKLAQFLKAGCNVKVRYTNLYYKSTHSETNRQLIRSYWPTFMASSTTVSIRPVNRLIDDTHPRKVKAPIELVEYRAEYYKYTISALLRALNVPVERLQFVLGSSYQLGREYSMDVYRACSITSTHDAIKSGAEVVKQSDSPPISGLIYPLLQALDEQYLDVHAQFGGVDQRKIFTLAKELLPRLGYTPRAHLMNHLVPSLQSGKMSSSDPNSKIDVLETPDIVARKIKKAVAAPKVVEGNGLLGFVEHVLIPASELLDGERNFKIEWDGQVHVYDNFESLRDDYAADKITPQMLKPAVTSALCRILKPIQAEFQASPAWQEIEKKAYPVEAPKEQKKQKQKKDKGSRYPGAAKASEVQAEEGKDMAKEPPTTADVGKSAADAMDKLSMN
ncbi:tyrosyl-tRNA synthetase [Penicillium hispanicum]|uniref:tyrosyl-tRNA synthetase n=1 Tax=Penicillium hispanicum TaxID=1080232 RepID=UPI00253F7467|nr:tyrosyl-tRNA synthetase [Penicillium hispanicum]KAJ5578762.1 tyrosyl-tRNA synthetase [Penicillium hispanicum]